MPHRQRTRRARDDRPRAGKGELTRDRGHGPAEAGHDDYGLLGWLDPEYRALLLISDHIEEPVRSLLDVANALTQSDEQRLAAQLFPLLVEENELEVTRAGNLVGAQRADDTVALPLWQLHAVV